MSSAPPNPITPQVLEYCRRHETEMLAFLKRLVETESPSETKAAVDEVGAMLAREFASLGGEIKLYPQKEFGDHLQASFHGAHGQKPIMLLGHFDTVWPIGTLKTMPYRVDNGNVHGPGIYDMKAGIAMMVFALRALKELGVKGHRPITIFLDTDEEVGSSTSRALTEAIARECAAVLVLEPSLGPRGLLKTARKGLGDCTIRVFGRASHSGVDFEKGQSAVVELARQILEVTKFVDLQRGITVNPGVIQGGTRSNVVAAEASAGVDMRVTYAADAAELMKKFENLKPFNPECRIEFSGGINRPPMERSAETVRLLETAQRVARTIGVELGETSTGGGSDGNFTAAMGIPTLDGLGAVGDGAHADNEHIVLKDMHQRCGILAGLLLEI